MCISQHLSLANGDVCAFPLYFAHRAASDRDDEQRRMSLSLSSPCPASVLQDILLSKHSLPTGWEEVVIDLGTTSLTIRNAEQVHCPPWEMGTSAAQIWAKEARMLVLHLLEKPPSTKDWQLHRRPLLSHSRGKPCLGDASPTTWPPPGSSPATTKLLNHCIPQGFFSSPNGGGGRKRKEITMSTKVGLCQNN